MKLSADQEQALTLAGDWWASSDKLTQPLVITGAAGTGKSTILSSILQKIGITEHNTMFVATSATAVIHVHDKNKHAHASTIASFIKEHNEFIEIHDNDDEIVEIWTSGMSIVTSDIDGLNADMIFSSGIIKDGDIDTVDVAQLNLILNPLKFNAVRQQNFEIVDGKPVEDYIHVVIVDELGMVSDDEMTAILAKKVPVIATGDPYQLPPIGAERTHYITDVDYEFYHELTEIHRQSDDSGLITLANEARGGGHWKSKASELAQAGASGIIVLPSIANNAKALAHADVILSPTNNGVMYFNKLLHEHFFGTDAPLSVGDKIVITSNSMARSDETGLPIVANGQSGVVKRIHKAPWLNGRSALMVDLEIDTMLLERVVVNTKYVDDPRISAYKLKDLSAEDLEIYRLRRSGTFRGSLEEHGAFLDEVVYLAYGYAMTIHRAQGKEWNRVIFDTEMPRRMVAGSDELVYTAITRAREQLLLI